MSIMLFSKGLEDNIETFLIRTGTAPVVFDVYFDIFLTSCDHVNIDRPVSEAKLQLQEDLNCVCRPILVHICPRTQNAEMSEPLKPTRVNIRDKGGPVKDAPIQPKISDIPAGTVGNLLKCVATSLHNQQKNLLETMLRSSFHPVYHKALMKVSFNPD